MTPGDLRKQEAASFRHTGTRRVYHWRTMAACASCGKEISEQAAFCPFCGRRATQEAGDAPAHVPQAPAPSPERPPPSPAWSPPPAPFAHPAPPPAPAAPVWTPPAPPPPAPAPVCSACGAAVKPGTRYCAACGSALPGSPPRPRKRRSGRPAAAGACLVLAGSVLPWLSLTGVSATAWELGLTGIITGRELASGLRLGIPLVLVVLALLPMVTGRPLARRMSFVLGWIALTLAGMTLIRGLTSDPYLAPGAGLMISAVGGLLMIVDDLRS